ncbi:NADPH-dependent FMN reductase [Neolewinella antarctica]|uniref:NAD(P)H-dependent FMN reductase n=1 Tax=Neolewinella antarctica TaxID=442734 RepID=A0ABX0X887_9BACT|nr:NAD(P)H-dependent oxidoreductase [Neolewinella antarctica]NJC25448.1 NAD(P)H-dependent FMN reductase [Neolewinella antarctica]
MRLLVSGSPHPASANSRLLDAFAALDPASAYKSADYLADLPVFQPALDKSPIPEIVTRWRREVGVAEAVIVCTPAYLHNIPGVLKNALDWLASSGELNAVPTIAMTFTPGPPRGARAMQSLLWSLTALNARVLTSAELYQSDAIWADNGELAESDLSEMIAALASLLDE